MRRRSLLTFLACLVVAVMAGQLRPTNEDSWTRSSVPAPPVFRTLPTTSVP